MVRRRRRRDTRVRRRVEREPGAWEDDTVAEDLEGEVDAPLEPGAASPAPPAPPGEAADAGQEGPYDVEDFLEDGLARIDLGGMLVPVLPGTEVRVDVADDQVVAANVVQGDNSLQLQAFAAPRSSGIWEEVRAELAAGISQSGGTADEELGTLGIELKANVPVSGPGGRSTLEPARFVAHDGPRWFLRAVLTGPAARDPRQAGMLEQAFRAVVVVRGTDPKPPREPLDLHLPVEPTETEPGEASDDAGLDPFVRGPEITETR